MTINLHGLTWVLQGLKPPAWSILLVRIKSLGQRTLWHTVKRSRSLVVHKLQNKVWKNTWMKPLLKAIISPIAIKVSTTKRPAVDFNGTFGQRQLTPKFPQREPPHYIKIRSPGLHLSPYNQGWHRLGWGLLSQLSPFRYFPNFSELSKYWLPMECHIHTWQMSPQLSCGDICQIWMWFKNSNICICKKEKFLNGEINGVLVIPTHDQLPEDIWIEHVWLSFWHMHTTEYWSSQSSESL